MTRFKASQGWNKPLENSLELRLKSSCFHKHQGQLQPQIPEEKLCQVLGQICLAVSPPGLNWLPLPLLPPPRFCCTAPSPEMQG